MSVQKPSIPKGTRDFSPAEMVRRNYIFDSIRKVFQLFGYQPIETPAMENLSTLLGKYGEEGDRLLFKILNSGDFLREIQDSGLQVKNHKDLLPYISEKGLRYDLTVPFARYVVQYQNDIIFPFKRYQMQPVWRADRPQKGRYREFFQCDVDVIGSNSLLNEVELIQIIDEIFSGLDVEVIVKLNNRKILAGIAEMIGQPDNLTAITVAIDKFDKSGLDRVNTELAEKGIPAEAIGKLQPLITLEGKIQHKINVLSEFLKNSASGITGLEEIDFIFGYLKKLNLKAKYEFDVMLARGLNYYTGAIIEVKAKDISIGSLCGGGRYDDLTGIFGLPGVSGVGVSFGADRIYDVMKELDRFPGNLLSTTTVLFINFGYEETAYCMSLLGSLRKSGISSEIFPDPSKLKKQLEYANKKNIPYVVLIGKDEMEKGILTVKNMKTGEQKSVGLEEFKKMVLL